MVIKMKIFQEEEFIKVNGIQQYVLHYPSKENNCDVLVYLHGGPGLSMANFGYLFDEQWNDLFHVVYYDQRGTGRTLLKNERKAVRVEQMIEDLRQTVEYLKRKYDVNQVVILGYSWGSVLGTIFVQKYPELVRYYISLGQVVDMVENEKVGYEIVEKRIIEKGNKRDLRKLRKVGEYPNLVDMNAFLRQCGVVRKLQGKYKLAMSINKDIIKKYKNSPVFQWKDAWAMLEGLKANKELFKFLFQNNFYETSKEYKVPVYYLLGDRDFQTPYMLAEKYFDTIVALKKKKFFIHDAGHSANLDQPEQCRKVYQEIVQDNIKEVL